MLGVSISTGLVLVSSFLPEALEYWTVCKARAKSKQRQAERAVAPTRLKLRIADLGCVACVKSCMGSLEAMGLDAEIVFEEKLLVVWLKEQGEVAEAVRDRVLARLEAVGFPATLKAMECGPTPSKPAVQRAAASECDDCGKVADGSPASGLTTLKFFGLGLASSSCCLIQLALNGLAVLGLVQIGCAGFNKWLGPVRLPMRVLTLIWLGSAWKGLLLKPRGGAGQGRVSTLVVRTAMTIFLMFLPELLQLGGKTSLKPLGANRLELTIDGMGCEACELHVRGVLEAAAGVINTAVSFEAGTAALIVGNGLRFNLTGIIEQLATDGYIASLA